ncbi:MAG: MFS transporter [Anaerolineaceae bacterium]|nr:MFS transporter [Anaerolineaceae bacterium]
MTAVAEPVRDVAPDSSETFQTKNILTIVSGHFVHDMYPAFIPALLPVILEKLAIPLGLAGTLQLAMSIPSLFSVLVGWLSDRFSVRYLVIFMPAVTGTLVTLSGQMQTYGALVALLFVTGLSVAAFHAPAPAMIARISGRELGKGMGFFMASGELGRSIGPLLVAFALAEWGVEGIWRVAVFGWLASGILYWRLRDIPSRSRRTMDLRSVLPHMRRVFIPLLGVMIMRGMLVSSLSFYMVYYLNVDVGFALADAALMLALFELAGVGGALAGGMLSDRYGRRSTVFIATVLGAALLVVFMLVVKTRVELVPIALVPLGFVSLSITPVLQAIVQDQFPDNRATASGLFILYAFLTRSVNALVLGMVGDRFGLDAAFTIAIVASLIALPLIRRLPARPDDSGGANKGSPLGPLAELTRFLKRD